MSWLEDHIADMLHGYHLAEYTDDKGDTRYATIEGPCWLEKRCAVYDGFGKGFEYNMSDVVRFEEAVDRITDLSVKAAIQLRMMGWEPENIGAVIRDRGHRPATLLISQGEETIAKYERRRGRA